MLRRVSRRAIELAALASLVAVPALAFTATTSAGAATTTTVTNTADDGTSSSLRGVLLNASTGDTVVLTAGATYQLTRCAAPASLGSGAIFVGDAVTIEGNGATIEQTCLGARVLFTTYDITLDNVTVTGGNTTDQGGGLFTNGAATTLSGVTFTGNRACAGGGVYANGPLAVTGSTFTENSVVQGNCLLIEGGAIEFDPEGVNLKEAGAAASGEATITDSTFSANSSDSNAGAIGAPSGSSMLVTGSTFTGNSSAEGGGALLATADGSTLTVVNSTFAANASCANGAIGADIGVDLNLVYDTLTGNTLSPCAGSVESAFDGHPSAVYVDSGSFAAFATVITGGPSETPNCEVSRSSGGSLGYNFSDEATDTCAFDVGTDNVSSANDPLLGALGDNGGSTLTENPDSGSPLIDAIPTAACGDGDTAAGFSVITDQRGFDRPDGLTLTCDIGAVEVQQATPLVPIPAPIPAPAVITAPRFTG